MTAVVKGCGIRGGAAERNHYKCKSHKTCEDVFQKGGDHEMFLFFELKTPPDQYPVSSKMKQNALKRSGISQRIFPSLRIPRKGSLGIAQAGGIPVDRLNPMPQ